MTALRYRVEPKDIEPAKAARRLGIDLKRFKDLLPRLIARGFPAADIDTGNFDLDEIDAWRARRHRSFVADPGASQSTGLASQRLAVLTAKTPKHRKETA